MTNQHLYLIRGLPGSGKSTLAKAMAGAMNLRHYETDMYFVGDDGVYRYNSRLLSEAHKWCQMQVRRQLEHRYSVIVSNTFVKIWEMQSYLDMAKRFNIGLSIIKCEGSYGNIHNVPAEVLQRMKDRWEDYE